MPRTEEANQQIREAQRAKILEAAWKVFAQKGRAATMADVATAASVSYGLVYRYFVNIHAYLTRTTEAVRRVFHGKVTYAALARLERVDWSLFDVICIDEYRDRLTRHSYGDHIKRYFLSNKPVVIGEFGCCPYQGAEDAGGGAWNIVDWTKMPPLMKGKYVYDQGVQARNWPTNSRFWKRLAWMERFFSPLSNLAQRLRTSSSRCSRNSLSTMTSPVTVW